MTINLEKDQTVYLRWLDSTNISGGWIYETLEANAKEIESIGFIVAINDKSLMLVSTRSNTGGVVNPITIPLGCIQDYQLIELRQIPPQL